MVTHNPFKVALQVQFLLRNGAYGIRTVSERRQIPSHRLHHSFRQNMQSYNDGPLYKVVAVCKGGGYRYARTEPLHPKANSKGLYPLHRVIMENKLERELLSEEQVHHIDGNRTNDNPNNLTIMSCEKHTSLHKTIPPINCTCPVCGVQFFVRPCYYRTRLKRSKYGVLFCSYACGAKHQHSQNNVV